MKVFISHSKPRSLALALALESFVRKVIQGSEPWVSKTGTDKGARWPREVASNLREVAAGIVVLTSENLDERWLLFEAGALSVKTVERVWTFLLDVEHKDVTQPLADFLHTKAEKNDTFEMVKSIHKTVAASGEKTNSVEDVTALFDVLWDKDLGPKVDELRRQGPYVPHPKREEADLLSEILEQVRQSARVLSKAGWRQEKSLLMLHNVYQAILGTPAPSLEELKHSQRLPFSIQALSSLQPGTLRDLARFAVTSTCYRFSFSCREH